MSSSNMPAILQAQSMLMAAHQVTSETALGLLVWAADRRGVTVAEAAAHVCEALAAAGTATATAAATDVESADAFVTSDVAVLPVPA